MIRDTAEIQKSNIWETTGKQHKKPDGSKYGTIVVLGQPNAGSTLFYEGKTSFIKVIKGDLDFETKTTGLIDYVFLRKTMAQRQGFHCYQIAKHQLGSMLGKIISADNIVDLHLMVCVDLSRPQKMVETLTQWIEIIRKECSTAFQAKQIRSNQVTVASMKKYLELHQSRKEKLVGVSDSDNIRMLPVATAIIGCKYDLYQKMDTESKKWVARALRYIAHTNGCSVLTCSTKNLQQGAQLRSAMNQYLCEQKITQQIQKDHMKAMLINIGDDDIASMNLPSSQLPQLQMVRRQIQSLFPESPSKSKQQQKEYREIELDTAILAKQKELQRVAATLKV